MGAAGTVNIKRASTTTTATFPGSASTHEYGEKTTIHARIDP